MTAAISTREQYRLVGWYDNAELTGNTVMFPYTAGENIIIATLYALWEHYGSDGTSINNAITASASQQVNINTSDKIVYDKFTLHKLKHIRYILAGLLTVRQYYIIA